MNNKELLIDFIEYAKSRHVMPILQSNIELLVEEYLSSRNIGNTHVGGWVNCPTEPNVGDRIIVWRENHKCYAEGIYEGNQSILTSPNCHFGSYDKWLLVKPCR